MAKTAGMGDNLFVDGVDLSGDTGSLSAIAGGVAPRDVTGINSSAFERIGGLRDGRIEWSAWFNPSGAHAALSTLPTADRIVTYCRGTTLGNPAAAMTAKQIGYDPTRAADASLTISVQALANGFGLEWGRQLTAGIDNLSGAGAGTGVDYGAGIGTTTFGLQAYLHVFSLTGTSATVAIQDSDNDNSGGSPDPYTDVTGAVFTAVPAASAPTGERIQTSRTESVKRWLRVNVTGTFSDLDFAVMVVKNESTVNF